MKNSVLATALLTLTLPLALTAQSAMPQMKAVEPASGVSGEVLTVTGEKLDQNNVAEVYLTDGKNDVKVTITEQTGTSLKFRIPAEAKPGRFALMVLTNGKDPRLIEEPVKVTIEAPPSHPAS